MSHTSSNTGTGAGTGSQGRNSGHANVHHSGQSSSGGVSGGVVGDQPVSSIRSRSDSHSEKGQQQAGLKILQDFYPSDDSNCKVILRFGKNGKLISTVDVPSQLSVPEWIHIRRSDMILQHLKELLNKEDILISSEDKPMVVELYSEVTDVTGTATGDKKTSIQKAFTKIQNKIEMQCYQVPDCLHKAALDKLQESTHYRNFKGTFWKSKDVIVFVANVESKDRVFNDFCAILCSVASEKPKVNKAASPDDSTTVQKSCTRGVMDAENKQTKQSLSQDVYDKFGQNIPIQFEENVILTPSLRLFLSDNSVAQQYVIDKLSKNGITCAFDDKDGILVMTSEDNRLKDEHQEILSNVVREKVINFSGKNVLHVYPLEEIERLLQREHETYWKKIIVLLHKPKQELTLVGTDDAVTSTEKFICQLIDNFADAEEINVPADDYKNLVERKWQEIEAISLLKSGTVKCVGIPQKGIKIYGKRATIEEFKEKMFAFITRTKQAKFTSPIMEPQLSLLIARSAVESFVTEEAEKIGIKVHVDLKKKRYVVDSGAVSGADSKRFLCKWHKTHTFPLDHDSGEWVQESIQSYFSECEALDDSKVLVKLEGSVINMIATADVISGVIQCLEEWKKQNDHLYPQNDYYSGRNLQQTAKTGDHLHQKKVTGENMSPPFVPEVSSLTSSPSDVDSLSESNLVLQVAAMDETDEIVEENGMVILKCNLIWPLTKYCKEIIDCKNHVKEEFRKKKFEIHINNECNRAKVKLLCRDDVTSVKDLFASFGAQVVSVIKEQQCHLTALEAKHLLVERNSDSENLVIYADRDGGRLVLFGKKKLLDSVYYTLREILDDYSDDVFCLTLTKEEQEDVQKGTLRECACDKVTISQKNGMLCVSGARVVLQEFRSALYTRLKHINESRQSACDSEIKKCYVTVSVLAQTFLKEKSVFDDIWTKFDDRGYMISLEEKVCFGALSFAALSRAEQLLKDLISEKKYALRQEPIFQLMTGDEISQKLVENLGGQSRFLAVVDELDLNIVCTSDVCKTIEKELRKILDHFTRETIDISDLKLGGKRNSDDLTRELFELDHQLMGKAKVLVDGRDLAIVTTQDLQQHVGKKVRQLLSKIESEFEINKKNPNMCVKLTELQLMLLDQPGVLHYIIKKVQNDHLQMTFDAWESCIRVYGLSEAFAKAGKTLIESCFRERKFSFLMDPILEYHELEDIEQMISVQHAVHSAKIVTAVDAQNQTLTLVCTDDVFQDVLDKVDHIIRSYPGAKVLCTREKMNYIKMFKSEELTVGRSDVIIETTVDGEEGKFEIKGQSSQVQLVSKRIEKLCAKVTCETFFGDNNQNFQILKTPEGCHAVQVTEKNTRSVISLREPQCSRPEKEFSTFQTEDANAVGEETKSSPIVAMDEKELFKLETGVIAVVFAEKKLPSSIYSALTHAGVIGEWTKFSGKYTKPGGKHFLKATSVKDTVQFGDKKLFRCEYVAFCQMPQWEHKGADKEKERTRDTTQYLLQECCRKSVSQLVIVIAVVKLQLFRRIAKQVIFEIKKSQDHTSPKVRLLCSGECLKHLQSILEKAEADTSSHGSGSQIKSRLKSTWKGSTSKGAAKVDEQKQIVLEIGALEKQKEQERLTQTH